MNETVLPQLNFTTTCIASGRYVIYYNERLDGVNYPDKDIVIPGTLYTELCEVLVYGKCFD